MKKSRIHWYTVFQIVFFALVFFVQNFPKIAIVFPLMTVLCIPARMYLAPRFMKNWELLLLDGDDEQIEEWVDLKNGTRRAISFGSEEMVEEIDEDEEE